MTMRFEWDAAKSRINQRKHNGLDFETAARVFDDASLVLIEDRIVEGDERACDRSRLCGSPFGSACLP